MKFTFGSLPPIGWAEPTGRLVELAQRAEAVGFDRFGVSDWRYYQDCFVVMTACLTATTRLQLESLTTDPYVRHPSLTAAALATMDELAPGRAMGSFEIDISMACPISEDRAALAGTAEECAGRLRSIQHELPEVTGVRIYAVPPAGRSLYQGYVDMMDQFESMIRLVNSPSPSVAA